MDDILRDKVKIPSSTSWYLEGYQSPEKTFVQMKMKSACNFRRRFVHSLIQSLGSAEMIQFC